MKSPQEIVNAFEYVAGYLVAVLGGIALGAGGYAIGGVSLALGAAVGVIVTLFGFAIWLAR